MTLNTVLLVSNDSEARDVWVYALRQMGLEVLLAVSASEAMVCWQQSQFDLILIDVCGAGLDGIGLARLLRAEAINPILLFTPYHDEAHILCAYQAGVDECVVKPVSPALFRAKVRAWLRRAWTVKTEALVSLYVGSVRLNPTERAVLLADGSLVRLTNLEFRVLHLLMTYPGQTLTTEFIVDHVWGYSGDESHLLKNVIYRLRRKVESNPGQPRYILTGTDGGYVFTP